MERNVGDVTRSVMCLDEPISPQVFFEQFVRARLPAKMCMSLTDSGWKGPWTNQSLRAFSGSQSVRVERRETISNKFGQGREEVISFEEFLDAYERGDETLYLTTQELEYSSEGQPSLVSAPVSQMKGNF